MQTTHERDAAIEAAIDEHQKRERPRLREHLQNQYVLHDLQRVVFEGECSMIEHLLKKSGADGSLERLIEKGCDRDHIVALLAMQNGGYVPPRWLGFRNRDELRAAANRVRDAEKVVRRVQTETSLFHHLSSHWVWFGLFPLLPHVLESYSSFLDFFVSAEEGKGDPGRELLVAHVVERTGGPCDNDVASLIASLPGHNGYSAAAHSKWRRRRGF